MSTRKGICPDCNCMWIGEPHRKDADCLQAIKEWKVEADRRLIEYETKSVEREMKIRNLQECDLEQPTEKLCACCRYWIKRDDEKDGRIRDACNQLCHEVDAATDSVLKAAEIEL